jgi:hypothetical protein
MVTITDERGAGNFSPGLDAQDHCGGSATPVVAHPRISRFIAAGMWGPLTRTIGPPGAGKTVAIALRAAACSYPCIWACFSLDDYSRPAAFWSYAVVGFQRVGGAVRRVLSAPRQPERPGHDDLSMLATDLSWGAT